MNYTTLISLPFVLFLSLNTLAEGEKTSGDETSACLEIITDSKTLAVEQLLKFVRADRKNRANKVNLNEATLLVATFIQDKAKFPTILEVPGILGTAYKKVFGNLSKTEQKQIRDELVNLALEGYLDSRQAIVDQIGKIILTQFSKDFTLPSFVDLAQQVGTKGTRLARYLYGEGVEKDEAQKRLMEEIETPETEEQFLKVKDFFARTYATRARESGRTLSLQEFYTGLTEKKPRIADHFTLAHLAHLLNEEADSSTGKAPPNYIQLFSSLEEVYEMARNNHPKNFDKVLNKYEVNAKSQQEIADLIAEKDRFFVTAAAPGVEVPEEAFVTMIKMAEAEDTFVVLFAESGQPANIDPFLLNHSRVHVIHQDIEVTPWFKLNTLPVHFKRIDPLSPLRAPGRGGQREQMQMVGNPQMRDELLPTIDNDILPRRQLTTGAMSKAWYAAKYPIGGVTDDQARDVHLVGFAIAEKDRDDSGIDGLGVPNTYYVRQVEWSFHSRSFTDLGVRYSLGTTDEILNMKPNGEEYLQTQLVEAGLTLSAQPHVDLIEYYQEKDLKAETTRPTFFIPGDKHIGAEDHYGFTQMEVEAIKEYRPKYLVLHDLVDLKSINHWEARDIVLMAKKAMAGELNLKDELDQMMAYLNSALLLDPELRLIVVESNHPNWLSRLLSEVNKQLNYGNQPINDPLVYELMHAQLNHGMNPIEYYALERAKRIEADGVRRAREVSVVDIIDPDRIQFLPKGASLKSGPMDFYFEVGEHGHNGGFGNRSITINASAGRSYTGILYGHTHTPGRNYRSGNAAASISPKQDYAKAGPAATGMAFILGYDDGTFQVNHFNINAEGYKLGDGTPLPEDEFFYKDPQTGTQWPQVRTNEESDKNLNTLDQFRRVSPDERNDVSYGDQ